MGCFRFLGKLPAFRLFLRQQQVMKRIAIFASGAGSNAAKIIQHFYRHASIEAALVVCNKPGAGVISIAQQQQLPVLMIERETFFRGNHYLDELTSYGIDFIVLAGFLWKIPSEMIAAYPEKILNIHPALLPNYGGKGMYGQNVHEAVLAAGDTESGISIHVVDEVYDNGKILFAATCPVLPGDTAETLAGRIHALEHQHYPQVIEKYISVFES